MNGIPTLVELEEDQFVEFVNLIRDIVIDIDGENITLNADFKQLTELQNLTILQIDELESVTVALYEYRTTQLREDFDLLEEGVFNINQTNIEGFLLLNQTLTDLYNLEREEVRAIADEFFRKLDKVNEVLSTINAFVDTIETVIGTLQTFISTTQNQNLVSQLTEQQRTNTLLQEFIDIFPTKVLTIIEETPFAINAPEAFIEDTFFTWCEITDPIIGEGSINCQTSVSAEVTIPSASIAGV